MTTREAAITLNMIPGLGSIKIQRLLEHFGSPEIILHADARLLAQVYGIGSTLAQAIASWRTTTSAAKEIDLADKAGATITTIFDDNYPLALRNIHDPPIVLYSWGKWLQADGNRSIGIVGPRLASHYGRLTAKRFSYELAETGVTIISGLAKGIDTEAHKAAIDAQGRTLAIIGSGLNQLYPTENRPLAERIAKGNGAVISEFPMNLPPGTKTFPMRNRIISAWSCATLVIEAPLRSGALITAGQAAEQGRQVFVVPGPIDRPHSAGSNRLIRDGATLVTSTADITADLGWHKEPATRAAEELPLYGAPPAPTLAGDEIPVHQAIRQGAASLETLCASMGMTAAQLTPILARLQIKRIIVPLPGGEFGIA